MTRQLGYALTRLALFTCGSLVACTADEPIYRPRPAAVSGGSGQLPTAGTGGGAAQPAAQAGSNGVGTGQVGAAGASVLIPTVTGGSGSSPAAVGGMASPQGCGTVKQSSELQLGQADIVWIIDGSGSMKDELAAVEQNIAKFADTIGAAGIDHHVVLLADSDLASTTTLGADAAHYQYVASEVGSHNALELLIAQYPKYQPFMRPGAKLHFVAVSDDESRVSAPDFQSQMQQLAGKNFFFHAIASEDVNGLPCIGACGIPFLCSAAAPGLQYYALADATSGEKVSICISDWSQVFGPLQQAVIASAPLPCDYAIPAPPSGELLDPDEVNLDFSAPSASKITVPRAATIAQCGTDVAWHYDDPKAPKLIHMCPAACEMIKSGGSIEIQLGCATIPLE